jgi:hypothetical protein
MIFVSSGYGLYGGTRATCWPRSRHARSGSRLACPAQMGLLSLRRLASAELCWLIARLAHQNGRVHARGPNSEREYDPQEDGHDTSPLPPAGLITPGACRGSILSSRPTQDPLTRARYMVRASWLLPHSRRHSSALKLGACNLKSREKSCAWRSTTSSRPPRRLNRRSRTSTASPSSPPTLAASSTSACSRRGRSLRSGARTNRRAGRPRNHLLFPFDRLAPILGLAQLRLPREQA